LPEGGEDRAAAGSGRQVRTPGGEHGVTFRPDG
jgi:hypothetical protein